MKCRVVIELFDEQGSVAMRWEQTAPTDNLGAFSLLGRAFELAQRDTEAPFDAALSAFLRGAVLEKADVVEALQRVDAKR